MPLDTPSFVHDYTPAVIRYGRGRTADLGELLADRGWHRALVVCGRHVGANRALMAPVEAGLGDRLAGIFAETTPEKRLETAINGVAQIAAVEADVLVAVGAGSSLDTAKAMSVLHGLDRPLDAVRSEVAETGAVPVPDASALTPTVAVPTTLAGADLSTGAGATVATTDGEARSVGMASLALMPAAAVYDPTLFETTPIDVLVGSAFNGFDKAVEALYSRHANPLTDATAIRSLRYFQAGLPALRDADSETMDQVVIGNILAQYGLAARGAVKTSVVHAFGHGLRRVWGVHQGIAHAVTLPAVLELLFDRVDARRRLLAEGLGVADAPDPADAVIRSVTGIRDALGLPSHIRELEGTNADAIPQVAEAIHADGYLHRGPADFDPTVGDVEAALEAAW